MGKQGTFDRRESDLKLFLILGRQLLGVDDLHFGYWPDDLEVALDNLPQAQECYAERLFSHMPEGARTILDVGCGVGKNAQRLRARGYEVEGVTPSAFLAAEAKRLVGDDFKIYVSRIEDAEIDRRYDVVLFSESFQYVETAEALSRCLGVLKPGGSLLICDFFRKGVEGSSPFNGGPLLSDFRQVVADFPLDLVVDIDISAETAPTMTLADELTASFFQPVYDLVLDNLRGNYPKLSKLFGWKLDRLTEKTENRYFNGALSGENFARYKSYRMLRFDDGRHPAALE